MGFKRGLKGMPLKVIVAQGIKKIQSSGRKDLQCFVDRLNKANEANDYEEVTKILAELATCLIQAKGKQIKA